MYAGQKHFLNCNKIIFISKYKLECFKIINFAKLHFIVCQYLYIIKKRFFNRKNKQYIVKQQYIT